MNSVQNKVKLRRELGLFSAVCLMISVMLGSGIFVSASNTLKNTGSVGMCLVVWVACGFLSLLAALSFAELGTLVNKSGGPFSIFQYAFADMHPFWGPLPGFVYSWVTIVFMRPAEVAILSSTAAEYLVRSWAGTLTRSVQGPSSLSRLDNTEYALKKAVSVFLVAIITYVNYIGVKCFLRIQNLFTVCKIIVCMVVIAGGLYRIYLGDTQYLMTGFEGTTLTFYTLPIAFYSGLWAYSGWTASVMVSEEIINPKVNILLSMLIAIPFITVIYVLMNISYLTVLSVSEMISAPAVAIEFGEHALGNFTNIIPLGVAISTFGCALSIQFETVRLCFAAGRKGQFLQVFSYVSVKNLTPAPAVLLQGLLAALLLASADIITLIEFASFIMWMFYGLCMVALMVMRRTKRDVKRTFKVPIIIPVFVLIMSVVLCLTPIVRQPKPQFLVALVFVLLAFILYIPFVYKKKKFLGVDNFTRFVQNLTGVVPPEMDDSNAEEP